MTASRPSSGTAAADPPAQLETLRRRLSADTLTVADLSAIADKIGQLADAAHALDLPVQRIAILGGLTTDFIAGAVACAILQEGVFPIVHQAPYGAYVQEILDRGSGLHRFAPELAVVVPDWRGLIALPPVDMPADTLAAEIAARVDQFDALWRALEDRHCRIIQHTIVPPPTRFRGVADRLTPASPERQVRALNDALLAAGAGRVGWLEADRLAAQIGLRAWHAERFYFAGKLGFDPRFLVDYLPWFRGAWRALLGRDKKVLAVDLDDTLWGGVIGDDGIEGIKLGAGDGAAGEAFATWQLYLKALGQRGVILAACSKNTPEIAAQGFDHADSVLARDDFAAFECSWTDKASALRRIAHSLNVGLDAIVFADDNPAEVALVRQALPDVATVELGADPAGFVARLEAGHWFDLARYTDEDARRTATYRARRTVEAARQIPGTDLAAYLRGLEMVGRIAPAGRAELARLAQLELRTNQFNLTTRRYGEVELARWLERTDTIVLALWLKDRFADHGLTSMLIAVADQDGLRIDDWAMSCRIFGRTAEQLMLAHLIDEARRRGHQTVIGEYAPTAKNSVVADLYPRLGFAAASPDGRWWRRAAALPVDDLETAITPSAP
jgi:FkbH-like protein